MIVILKLDLVEYIPFADQALNMFLAIDNHIGEMVSEYFLGQILIVLQNVI